MSDWVCGRCKSINRERSATCYSCGGIRGAIQMQPGGGASLGSASLGGSAAMSGSQITADAGAGAGVGVGAGAAALSGQPLAGGDAVAGMPVLDVSEPEAKPVLPAAPQHLLGGLLGGAIGAVLATALWAGVVAITNWQIGFVAIAVGFIVGQAVVFGAGGRGSILLVPISLGLTLVALGVGEYVIQYTFASQVFGSENMIGIVQPPGLVLEVIGDSLSNDPLTLVFWAIAGFQAVAIPWRTVTRAA